MENKVWCPLPWTGLFIDENSISPCTYARQRLSCSSIEDYRSHPFLVKLKQDLTEGTANTICEYCDNFGSTGQEFTPRVMARNAFLKERDVADIYSTDFEVCEVRFSNVCNFKCRTCSPMSSSLIAAEERNAGKELRHPIVIEYMGPTLVDQVKQIAGGLKVLKFSGGEPIMMPQVWELLHYLITTGKSPDIDIWYDTNGSNLTFKNTSIIDLWSKFRSVNVTVSLDALGSVAEYWRNGTIWDKVNSNLRAMINSGLANVRVNTVATWVTAFQIAPLYQHLVTEYGIYPQLSRVDSYKNLLSIQVLSQMKKDMISNELRLLPADDPIQQAMIENLIEHMNAKDLSHLTADSLAEQFKLDARRGESFFDIFPEHKDLQ